MDEQSGLAIYRAKAARPRTPARPAPERAAALPAPAVGRTATELVAAFVVVMGGGGGGAGTVVLQELQTTDEYVLTGLVMVHGQLVKVTVVASVTVMVSPLLVRVVAYGQ